MSPEIKIVTGALPPFWDRNVLFFCNLRSIFYENDAEAAELVRQITGSQSYGGRVVSILNLLFHRGPNKILLEAAPEANLLDYLSGDLALSLPAFEVLDHSGYQHLAARLEDKSGTSEPLIEELKDHPAQWVDGYVTDAVLVEVARRIGKRTVSSLSGSKNGNNKYLLHRYQVKRKLPVFDTFMAESPAEVPACLERLRKKGYKKAVIKAQIGASGYGMIKTAIEGFETADAPEYLFFEGPCMVQGWIDEDCPGVERLGSPSVQMFLNDRAVFLFDWTEQILSDESIHEGNQSPPPYACEHPGLREELFRQAGLAGEWLHAQGYRGTASVDFLVVRRESRIDAIICEINARVTGATYPSLLARHFIPDACWYMRNIQFRKALDGAQLLALLDQTGELYRPGREQGIIPFNFNVDEDGKVTKGQFLCLGKNHRECGGLLTRAWSELPVEWGYDRD
ncbi:MAG TPA: hypothetical protein VL754_19675 [Verrucomicrobiae bacterium]|nr:hypothetical protein [Verrucomicrobiae bacterium]